MAGWTEQDLLNSWRALARQSGGVEWRFVPLTTFGQVRFEVGCHFPGGMEALVMLHPKDWTPSSRLPLGKGFDTAYLRDEKPAAFASLALVRQPEGSQDIFGLMAADLLRLIEANRDLRGPLLVETFVARVAEWQDFMSRRQRPLSPEAQVGLMGELEMLEILASGPLAPEGALAAWQGPLHAAQDFHVGAGALEVKSTVIPDRFPAKITSIAQLDSERLPLFLCAFRFSVDDAGRTLPEIVESLRRTFAQFSLQKSFDALLIVVGYTDEHAAQYGRKLLGGSVRAFSVDGAFPRLRRAEIPAAILSARYVLDIDSLDPDAAPAPVSIEQAIQALGLVTHVT